MSDSEQQTLTLDIDSLASGGEGVGRTSEGRVVFVPKTAPGDRALVRVVQKKKSFSRAQLVSLEQASQERVVPPCKLFIEERCGGCQWQHLSLESQRLAKVAQVRSAMRRVIDDETEVAMTEAPLPEAYAWRRRAALSFASGRGDEPVRIGFAKPKSHHLTDVIWCPQCSDAINHAISLIREHWSAELKGQGRIYLVEDDSGSVGIEIDGTMSERLAAKVVGQKPITGVRWKKGTLGEASHIVDGLSIHPADFSQASTEGNRALLFELSQLESEFNSAKILELYAGAGNLTRALTGAEEVVAVDQIAHKNATPANVSVVSSSVESFIQSAAAKRPFDWLILDPPRTGAAKALENLEALGHPKIVYVSCDPATLARDAENLGKQGYRCQRVRVVDMMPQTSKVEMLTLFVPSAAAFGNGGGHGAV